MPGTLTVRTITTHTGQVRQEISLDIKPKGAQQNTAQGKTHDVGAAAFFSRGSQKSSAQKDSSKAGTVMRTLEAPPASKEITMVTPKVAEFTRPPVQIMPGP
mmetsp:Transcript_81300/g.242266  ORF Transcript_81300/g.242266 Transcript_81300/m.242266 type:complete len:102 (-) Transcript_81300:66-371(-)